MLKIHKPFSKHKLFFLGITSICITSGLCAFSYLTYTPELSHAETVTYRSLDDITYMQEMTAAICKASAENETKQLIDSRDGKSYWVTKLKDDNCWMTQNLDLDLANRKLTTADSDVLNDWTSTTGVSSLWATSDSDYNVVKYYDPGEFVYTTPIEQNDCGAATKLEGCKNWTKVAGLSTSSSNNEQAHYLAGNYYSWAAATAGQAATLTSSTAGEQSTQSICPKGWTLPTSGSGGQFETLTSGLVASTTATATANNLKLAPYYFVYGGYISNSSLYNAGSGGYYWSSTAYNASSAYSLSFSASVGLARISNRHSGMSVRCVARTEPEETRTLANTEYMQDVTAEICANTPEATADGKFQYQLKDSRDQKTYWVAKLKDGNCWMTQNLDLDLWNNETNTGIKLTSDDSDLPYGAEWVSDTGESVDWGGISYIDKNTPKYFDRGYVACIFQSLTCEEATNTNELHYMAGNYYSWGAATAGQASSLTSDEYEEQATQSICPKQWQLPVVNYENGSFYYLLDKYGLSKVVISDDGYNINHAPLYFTYTGLIASGGLVWTGTYGDYWGGTTRNSTNALGLLFVKNLTDSNGTTISLDSNGRMAGRTIRCMVKARSKADLNNIQITISPQLSLDATPEVEVKKSETNPSTADLKVKVASNQPYSVNINAKEHAELVSENGDSIPSNGGALTTAENNWGIQKPGESTYTKITTTPQLFYQSTSPEAKDILFKIGISTSPDLPNGEYSTNITITATQN